MFELCTLHFTYKCQNDCWFCYQKEKGGVKPYEFWLDCLPFLGGKVNQTALGGGEPLYSEKEVEFVQRFSKRAADIGLTVNLTTSGHGLKEVNLPHISILSISYDNEKYDSLGEYKRVTEKFNNMIGCNYLLTSDKIPEKVGDEIRELSEVVDRIYLLHPKGFEGPDRLRQVVNFAKAVGDLHSTPVYIDDLTNVLLNDSVTCHYGKEVFSIRPDGGIAGCSFVEPEMYIEKPEDLKNVKFSPNNNSPCGANNDS